jgi:hypothetical protein
MINHIPGILVTGCGLCLLCPTMQATVTSSIQPTSVYSNPGDVGDAFNVILTNSGLSSISIESFSFEVSVTDPDITLTSADFSTLAFPYIFAGDSFDVINGFALNTNGPGQTLDASDVTNDGAGVTLSSGESLALGRVLFDVSPTAALDAFTVSFTGTPTVADGNNLSDPTGDSIVIDFFAIGTVYLVPEPSSLLPTLAGVFALAGIRRWRRSGSRRLALGEIQ